MKNKRSSMFLPNKTLDFVLAIIVLGLLFFIIWSFANTFIESSEKRQAKALLKEIENSIIYLENNKEVLETEVLLLNPSKWFVVFKQKEGLICVCPEEEFNSCNQIELCYFSGYEVISKQDFVVISIVFQEGNTYFQSLNFKLNQEKRELKISKNYYDSNSEKIKAFQKTGDPTYLKYGSST